MNLFRAAVFLPWTHIVAAAAFFLASFIITQYFCILRLCRFLFQRASNFVCVFFLLLNLISKAMTCVRSMWDLFEKLFHRKNIFRPKHTHTLRTHWHTCFTSRNSINIHNLRFSIPSGRTGQFLRFLLSHFILFFAICARNNTLYSKLPTYRFQFLFVCFFFLICTFWKNILHVPKDFVIGSPL